MTSRGTGQRGAQGNPPRLPQTPPENLPSGDYSFVLEIVMHMQETMGGLKEAVSELKESVKEIKAEQKEQTKKIEGITIKIYTAIAVLAIIGFLLQLFGPSINNLVSHPTAPPAIQQPAK